MRVLPSWGKTAPRLALEKSYSFFICSNLRRLGSWGRIHSPCDSICTLCILRKERRAGPRSPSIHRRSDESDHSAGIALHATDHATCALRPAYVEALENKHICNPGD